MDNAPQILQLSMAERQFRFYGAVRGGRADLVSALLRHGVDPNLPDCNGVPARLYFTTVPWIKCTLKRLGPYARGHETLV